MKSLYLFSISLERLSLGMAALSCVAVLETTLLPVWTTAVLPQRSAERSMVSLDVTLKVIKKKETFGYEDV